MFIPHRARYQEFIDSDYHAIIQHTVMNDDKIFSTEYFQELIRKPRKGSLKI